MMNLTYRRLLLLIVVSFVVREVFLVGIFPIFKGQDEARHYNTIQYLTNRADNRGDCLPNDFKQIKSDFSTYRYSQEIRTAAKISQSEKWGKEIYNGVHFSDGRNGFGEVNFKKESSDKKQIYCSPDIATNNLMPDNFSYYHKGLAWLEKLLEGNNIFVRYFSLRLISVLLGAGVIFLSFFVFKESGFSQKASLLLASIISFQPKLSIYLTNINYDSLLIFLWTLTFLGGVLLLNNGKKKWVWIILSVSIALALSTKPSALPLIGLAFYILAHKIWQELGQSTGDRLKEGKTALIIIILLLLGGFVYNLLQSVGVWSLIFGGVGNGLGDYLKESLPKIFSSSRNYWGVLSWGGQNYSMFFVKIIWLMEWLAWFGLFVFWLAMRDFWGKSKKRFIKSEIREVKRKYLQNLSDKYGKFFWLAIVSIFLLQVGIRVADWKIFNYSGKLALGTPGRYWLPNIVPHFLVLAIGFKFLFGVFSDNYKKRRDWVEKKLLMILKILLILMAWFWFYNIFSVIIPRFYF